MGKHRALISNVTGIVGGPPAEADMQHHFHVTPSSVHQMVLNLENAGLIESTPGAAKSICVLVQPEELPYLE